MDNTIVQQGRFTATGLKKTIKLRSDIDWMKVYNATTLAAGGAGTGVEFYWQRGMAANTGFEYQKLAADDSMSPVVLATGGFTLIDTSTTGPGAVNATITGVSAAAIPIVSLTDTTGLVNGDVVRFINVTGGQQLGGIEFEIDTLVANTSFRLPYMAQIVAATTGSFRRISQKDPIPSTPRPRFISNITQAAQAVVTLTVTHNYEVGSVMRMQVPAAYGMAEMNGISATITAVSVANNTVTIDVDSTGFTAFAFPLTAAVPFTPAKMIPFGTTNTDSSDALYDTEYIAVELAPGTDSPAGAANDVIYWVAGKSFSVTNE